MNESNVIFDIIIALVEGITNDDKLIVGSDNEEHVVCSCNYLLSQYIRQYQIPNSHYFISVKAKEKWQEITDDNIEKYCYQDKVTCKNDDIIVYKFVGGGNASTETILMSGSTFAYRSVFHDEHIVAISDIINELIRLQKHGKLNYQTIQETLNLIYVCRMLKTEDRKIQPKKGRGLDYKKVIDTHYKQANIEVCKWIWDEPTKNKKTDNQLEQPKKITPTNEKNGKFRKGWYYITNEKLSVVNHEHTGYLIGYKLYDDKDNHLGIVTMETYGKPSNPWWGQALMVFLPEHREAFRTYHRMRRDKERVSFKYLESQVLANGKVRLYVE